MHPRPDEHRSARRGTWAAKRGRTAALLPFVLLLASCTSVVTGTPQTAAGALVERPLTARARSDLAGEVIFAHAALSSMSRTVVHRDPISTDRLQVVETRVDDRVDRIVTFMPTSPDVWSIEEIRCVDRHAYATPPPEGLEVDTPWVEVPIDPPVDEGTDAGAFIAYYCQYGYPEDLAYDTAFLDQARVVLDLGAETVDGVPVRRYRAELDRQDAAAGLHGLVWLYDDTAFDEVADTVTVDFTVDEHDYLRTLDSAVVADEVEYGDTVVFAGFDEGADVSAPDPAEVTAP